MQEKIEDFAPDYKKWIVGADKTIEALREIDINKLDKMKKGTDITKVAAATAGAALGITGTALAIAGTGGLGLIIIIPVIAGTVATSGVGVGAQITQTVKENSVSKTFEEKRATHVKETKNLVTKMTEIGKLAKRLDDLVKKVEGSNSRIADWNFKNIPTEPRIKIIFKSAGSTAKGVAITAGSIAAKFGDDVAIQVAATVGKLTPKILGAGLAGIGAAFSFVEIGLGSYSIDHGSKSQQAEVLREALKEVKDQRNSVTEFYDLIKSGEHASPDAPGIIESLRARARVYAENMNVINEEPPVSTLDGIRTPSSVGSER